MGTAGEVPPCECDCRAAEGEQSPEEPEEPVPAWGKAQLGIPLGKKLQLQSATAPSAGWAPPALPMDSSDNHLSPVPSHPA